LAIEKEKWALDCAHPVRRIGDLRSAFCGKNSIGGPMDEKDEKEA
jgi:hypothetical protein